IERKRSMGPRLREDDVGLGYWRLVMSRFLPYQTAQFAFCDNLFREDDVSTEIRFSLAFTAF
ncbi:MAG: hypothetical protein V4857_28830, partial [Pseudomonadota bacterium]